MKKLILVAAVAFLAVSLSSCKKDYTCSCKNPDGSEAYPPIPMKTTKKKAKETCDLASTTYSTPNNKVTCTL